MNNNELYHHGILGMKWRGRKKVSEYSVMSSGAPNPDIKK